MQAMEQYRQSEMKKMQVFKVWMICFTFSHTMHYVLFCVFFSEGQMGWKAVWAMLFGHEIPLAVFILRRKVASGLKTKFFHVCIWWPYETSFQAGGWWGGGLTPDDAQNNDLSDQPWWFSQISLMHDDDKEKYNIWCWWRMTINHDHFS